MAKFEHSIEVNVPVGVVYQQLTRFEEFPRFMKGVHSVHQLDDAHLHWYAEHGGKDMEWDSEITEHMPERCIAWRNTNGPRNEGKFIFEAIGSNRTRIFLSVDGDENSQYRAAGQAGQVFHEDDDLARFKKMIESQQFDNDLGKAIPLHAARVPKTETASAAYVNGDADGGDASSRNVHSSQAPTEAPSARLDAMPSAAAYGTYTATGNVRAEAGSHANNGHSASNMSWAGNDARESGRYTDRSRTHASSAPGIFHMWSAPFAVMRRMKEEMDRAFIRMARPAAKAGWPAFGPDRRRQAWTPPIDIAKFQDDIVIFADLPGVRKEDLEIKIRGDQMTIEGERRNEHALHFDASRRTERNQGRFFRAITLPKEINTETVKAHLRDGVLEVHFPRIHFARRAHKVEIRQEND